MEIKEYFDYNIVVVKIILFIVFRFTRHFYKFFNINIVIYIFIQLFWALLNVLINTVEEKDDKNNKK